MQFSRLLISAFVGLGLGTLPDWFFGGVLFHDKYNAHPEVWRRPGGGPGENRAVALSAALSLVTYFGFAYLYAATGANGLGTALRMATAVWLLAPVPIIASTALWVKMHPALVLSHTLGWLVKLWVAAFAAAWVVK